MNTYDDFHKYIKFAEDNSVFDVEYLNFLVDTVGGALSLSLKCISGYLVAKKLKKTITRKIEYIAGEADLEDWTVVELYKYQLELNKIHKSIESIQKQDIPFFAKHIALPIAKHSIYKTHSIYGDLRILIMEKEADNSKESESFDNTDDLLISLAK